MNRFLAPALLVISILSFSCDKDEAAAPAQNFFPLTAGSSWTYRETTANITYTFTATNRDSSFLGKNYRVLTNSLGGNVYATVVGNDYYRYGLLPTQQLTGSGVEEYFLKANAGVGGTWNQTQPVSYGGQNYNLRLNYTLTSVDGTRTVAGKAYSKVALVTLGLQLAVQGFNINAGDGTFYYADGVGLIESNLNISVALPGQPAQSLRQNTLLQSYSIK